MSAPIVEISGLTHAYETGPEGKPVLRNVSLSFAPGEIAVITGPSGSGKTTLLTLIGALRSVQAGSIKVFGRELRGLDARGQQAVRAGIGFIFQSHNLFDSLTAEQTLRLAMELRPYSVAVRVHRPREMLAELGIADRAQAKPAQLSVGQRQRVAVARALINEPRLILADEPTAALDADTGRHVVRLLQQRAEASGGAVLIVTHDPRIVEVSGRVIHLLDGAVVSDERRVVA